VVLLDRRKLRLKMAVSATVAQLYQHVLFETKSTTCTLAGGFPPKPLTDYSQTITEAGLLGASVTQRQ
jgi:hypothetical protein